MYWNPWLGNAVTFVRAWEPRGRSPEEKVDRPTNYGAGNVGNAQPLVLLLLLLFLPRVYLFNFSKFVLIEPGRGMPVAASLNGLLCFHLFTKYIYINTRPRSPWWFAHDRSVVMETRSRHENDKHSLPPPPADGGRKRITVSFLFLLLF